jgi:hypothetical protein
MGTSRIDGASSNDQIYGATNNWFFKAGGTVRATISQTYVGLTEPLQLDEHAAPSTPSANQAAIWLDSTSNNLMIKFDSGNTAVIATYV